jgi:hypothetical protein
VKLYPAREVNLYIRTAYLRNAPEGNIPDEAGTLPWHVGIYLQAPMALQPTRPTPIQGGTFRMHSPSLRYKITATAPATVQLQSVKKLILDLLQSEHPASSSHVLSSFPD